MRVAVRATIVMSFFMTLLLLWLICTFRCSRAMYACISKIGGWPAGTIKLPFRKLNSISMYLRAGNLLRSARASLEQKLAVAVHGRLICSFDPKGDTLVLGDRVVEIAHLAQQRGEPDLAEPFEPPAMLDFGNSQQRRDDGQRLVETGDRLIGDRP